MEFEELFNKALQGRTINQAAKDWGVPYATLNRYSKGDRVPDYQTAMVLSREAQVDRGEVMEILARLEARKKPRSLFPDLGFAAAGLVIAVNLFLTPGKAEAAPRLDFQAVATENTLYYVKLMMRNLRNAAKAFACLCRSALTAAM